MRENSIEDQSLLKYYQIKKSITHNRKSYIHKRIDLIKCLIKFKVNCKNHHRINL